MINFRCIAAVALLLAQHQSVAFVPSSIRSSLASKLLSLSSSTSLRVSSSTVPPSPTEADSVSSKEWSDEITKENPLKVYIAGGGVGGLTLANILCKNPLIDVVVLERTDEFKRFGGPIQLASNALEILKTITPKEYDKVIDKFTITGDKENGIKDGIRNEWYAKFDLGTPAESRNMPYTGVIDRPDLQEIYLNALPEGVVQNGDAVESFVEPKDGKKGFIQIGMKSGKTLNDGDVLIGADGIWSNVRATMNNEPPKGEGSGATYSGYTVFAGELAYDSFDNGQVGYKVYIGPGQYFVITDIGNGNYQWYAFLAREPGSAETEEKPDGSSKYLQNVFVGWSKDIHHILKATKEHEIEQRDLYDRPPSVLKPWTSKNVALLGDSVHAMMPNLGQGGCQAIEDALVLGQELSSLTKRSDIQSKLEHYRQRRLIRSAAVQGLSRFASDIIIRGFDTPAKIVKDEKTGKVRFENFNYAGIVTKILQPILPIFFYIQFNFLYDGWKNEVAVDLGAGLGLLLVGSFILILGAGAFGEVGTLASLGLRGLIGVEAIEALFANIRDFLHFQ